MRINEFLQQIARMWLLITGGFRGRPIQRRHLSLQGSKGRCHGNQIWPKNHKIGHNFSCMWHVNAMFIFSSSIAHSEKHRYLSYSEANFEVFRPTGTTRCTDRGWNLARGKGPNFIPIDVMTRAYPKLIFLVRFDQNLEYKHPSGAGLEKIMI